MCIALFASVFEYWVFGVLGVHSLVMVVWHCSIADNRSRGTITLGFLSVCIMLFYVPCRSNPSRFMYIFYYTIFYSENFFMFAMWVFRTRPYDVWFYIPCVVAVLSFFVLHIRMQLSFYLCFHPGGDENKIPYCLPCRRKFVKHSLSFNRSQLSGDKTSQRKKDGAGTGDKIPSLAGESVSDSPDHTYDDVFYGNSVCDSVSDDISLINHLIVLESSNHVSYIPGHVSDVSDGVFDTPDHLSDHPNHVAGTPDSDTHVSDISDHAIDSRVSFY